MGSAVLGGLLTLTDSIVRDVLTYRAEGNSDVPGILRSVDLSQPAGIAQLLVQEANSIFGFPALLSGVLLGATTAFVRLSHPYAPQKTARLCTAMGGFLAVPLAGWGLLCCLGSLGQAFRDLLITIGNSFFSLPFLWSSTLLIWGYSHENREPGPSRADGS